MVVLFEEPNILLELGKSTSNLGDSADYAAEGVANGIEELNTRE
jgi:hypothetical protein